MRTLVEIKEQAIEAGACYAQFNKFIEFLESGDELQAWQTVLGNFDWFKVKGIISERDNSFIEQQAQGVGKRWYDNGQLRTETTYQNGERHGLYKIWHDNGQLEEDATYQNGKRV